MADIESVCVWVCVLGKDLRGRRIELVNFLLHFPSLVQLVIHLHRRLLHLNPTLLPVEPRQDRGDLRSSRIPPGKSNRHVLF
jgi:hypothetical protein